MTTPLTPREPGQDDRSVVLRERLAQQQRRYDDARLDVKLARDRWATTPVEDHRLALIDELAVGICVGRAHVACLDDLHDVVGPDAADLAAARGKATVWLDECSAEIGRLGHSRRA